MSTPTVQPAAHTRKWLAIGAAFAVVIVLRSMALDNADLGHAAYQICLFSLCTLPYFTLAQRPVYRLLAIFLLFYYAIFGLQDLIVTFAGESYAILEATQGLRQTALADLVIICGAASAISAYVLVSTLWKYQPTESRVDRWIHSRTLAVGTVAWIIGIACYYVVQFVYGIEGPRHPGVLSITISNLYYLAIIGAATVVVAAFHDSGGRRPWFLLAMMILVEYALGFLGNTKEVSYRMIALVAVLLYFLRGTLSGGLILLTALSFIPYQVAFNVYREQVLQFREQGTLQAISDLGNSTDTVKSGVRAETESIQKSIFLMIDRVDCRKYIEIITQRTGSTVPYQNGATFKLLAYAFVPKAVWPGKPQISTGQLMNRTFQLSESPLTFVPSTMLGEFYWNFGFLGSVVGMLCLGALFGVIGNAFPVGANSSTIAILFTLMTTYFLVARFEASIGSQFSQWIRVSLLLVVVNKIFTSFGWTKSSTPVREEHRVHTIYPNLLRE